MNADAAQGSSLADDFLREISAAGIEVVIFDGVPNMALTYDAIKDYPELLSRFSRIVVKFTNKREFRDETGQNFYHSRLWLRVRYLALAKFGNNCLCCGAKPSDGAVLHVDHIKPKSRHPELALSIDNLQVLCGDCNIGKGNVDETDWRAAKP